MEGGGARVAAASAAVLGSRNARRQMQAALAHAAEFGAYSVGFQLGRGCLTGFTIYLAGNFAGCGAGRASSGTAAVSAVPPPSAGRGAAGHAQPKARAAAARGQQSVRHAVENVAEKRDPSPASVPQGEGQPQAHGAPRRQRGCRAGVRRRARRDAGSRSSLAAAADPCMNADGSSMNAVETAADECNVLSCPVLGP